MILEFFPHSDGRIVYTDFRTTGFSAVKCFALEVIV